MSPMKGERCASPVSPPPLLAAQNGDSRHHSGAGVSAKFHIRAWETGAASPSRIGGPPVPPFWTSTSREAGDVRSAEGVSRRRGGSASAPPIFGDIGRGSRQGRSEIDPRKLQPIRPSESDPPPGSTPIHETQHRTPRRHHTKGHLSSRKCPNRRLSTTSGPAAAIGPQPRLTPTECNPRQARTPPQPHSHPSHTPDPSVSGCPASGCRGSRW